jgi:hypothetical protein
MFSVEADNSNRLIKISWSENVSADEMRECAEQLRALTADMKPLRLNLLTASPRRLAWAIKVVAGKTKVTLPADLAIGSIAAQRLRSLCQPALQNLFPLVN